MCMTIDALDLCIEYDLTNNALLSIHHSLVQNAFLIGVEGLIIPSSILRLHVPHTAHLGALSTSFSTLSSI